MRKLIAILLSVVMCLSFAACNSEPQKESSSPATTEEKAPETTEKEEPAVTTVNFGDTIITDFLEMTFEDFQVTERLLCSVNSRGDNIILGEVVEGKKVIYLSGSIKNIHTDPIGDVFSSNDCIWGTVCFDGKYNYDIKMYIQNGEDMKGTLSPFSTGTYYLYAHIPDELLESYTSCTFSFGFCENLQSYDSSFNGGYSYEECEYKYSVSVTE